MKIYRANYESRNFSFEAYGKTKEDAKASLMIGLLRHMHQYDLDPDWYYKDDISVVGYQLDIPYRDCSIIKGE
jgi:hypothetical protein